MTRIIRKDAPAPSFRTAAKDERARLIASARDDITLVKKQKAAIGAAFYDIGQALTRLRAEPIPKLLGYASFAMLCKEALRISPSTAEKLVRIVAKIPRSDALRWGKEKAAALIDLAAASGRHGPITSRIVGRLDPERASVREIRALATRRRGASTRTDRRGRSASEAERGTAAELEKRLKELGLETARATAVATRPGLISHLRVSGVPLDQLAKLRKALSRLA